MKQHNNNNKNKKRWVKKRHGRVFAFLRFLMRPFFKLRYNYTAEKYKLPRGAYLILSNHQTTMDPFLLSLSFKFPIYFMTSDDLFNLKVSPLIKYLVAPIPKSKSFKDIVAVRNVFRVIKEGGAVGIFPEGNRTISDGQWEITDAVARLCKSCKVPIVLYNLCGGYGTDPRWGHNIRKGKAKGFIKRIIYPEELESYETEQLTEIIRNELRVQDTLSGVKFRSSKRAEYIERALYICPECGEVSSFRSRKNVFKCKSCNLESSYTPELRISPEVHGYNRIYEWFDWQQNEIVRRVRGGEEISDNKILFRESIKFKRKRKLDGQAIAINKDALTVIGKHGKTEYPIADVESMAMVGKKKINFYYGGKILQIKGDSRFCAIKYVHVFEGVKKALGELN